MVTKILLGLIIIVNGYFLFVFVKDLLSHKEEFKAEKGDVRFLPFTSFIMFFLSAFGISDFAIGTVLYPKYTMCYSSSSYGIIIYFFR
jgi:hypothetical protein